MPHDGWHPHDRPQRGHPHEHPHHPRRRMVLAAATFLPFGGASAQTVDAGQRIADAATRFLAGLDDAQRKQVLIAFEVGQSPRLALHPAQPAGPDACARCGRPKPKRRTRCSPRC